MNSSYTTMISNPLKPGKNFHFSVRRLNQTLSRKKKKNKKSSLDIAQFYILSYNSNPNEFRPRCIPPIPKITAKQSDSTRRFNRHARAITSHRSLQPCEKRNNPWYNVTKERNIDARGESANMTIRRESWSVE